MLVGQDFDKVGFSLMGLDMLEPNAFFGDILIFAVSVILGMRINPSVEGSFEKYWKNFFIWFGFAYLLGAFGHGFYNYWGVSGKIPGLFLSLAAPYFIEQALITRLIKGNERSITLRLSEVKLFLSMVALVLLVGLGGPDIDPATLLLVPALSSFLGLTYVILFLYISRNLGDLVWMKKLLIGYLVLLPSLPIQILKVNIHPLFDRNDIGHLLVLAALFFWNEGVKVSDEVTSLESASA